MAVANGYGKVVTSGSAFMYDTGDTVNSYKGKPGYNVTGTPAAWVGNNNTSDFKTTIGTTTVNIPAIGTKEVSFVDIWNTGASNCCPSLFRYGDWGITTGVTGNTLYTYSIIYKTNSGYTHPNFMYRYEFNGGSYITEVGVFDNAKRIDLGDGWYQAYNTFTTNASTNTLYLGMWYYQYNVYDTVYLYKASLTQGNHVFPPDQFIPPSTTRSATQGLLPLVGNSSIDLSSVSFNSTAQIIYDGTDDHVDLGNLGTIGTSYSIECVFNSSNVVNYRNVFDMNYATYPGVTGNVGPRLEQYSDGTITVVWSGVTNNNSIAVNTPVTPISANTNYHMVFTQDGNNGSIYLNGAYKSQNSNTYGYVQTFGDANLGRGFSLAGDRYFAGSLPMFKIYNRALSSTEIKQNYNKYKTRFNLS
jgi:hypothetical protein